MIDPTVCIIHEARVRIRDIERGRDKRARDKRRGLDWVVGVLHACFLLPLLLNHFLEQG